MTNYQPQPLPYKSIAAALLFSIFLGPIGLLYASFWGGFFMLVVAIIVVSSKLFFPILLMWMTCCLWGVKAAESYNHKIFRKNSASFKTATTELFKINQPKTITEIKNDAQTNY